MTCKSCEARREWMIKHARQAKERMQRVLMSLRVGTKQSVDSIDQPDGKDQQRAERTDQ
jgi:hypothetical protein